MYRFAALMTLALVTGTGVAAQDTDRPASRASGSVMLGLGNSAGGVGAVVEPLYAGKFSAFAGLGYLPDIDTNPGTLGASVGARLYSGLSRHRAFAEASVSMLELEYTASVTGYSDIRRHYGPSAALGYRYQAPGGFTMIITGGAGYSGGSDGMVPAGTLAMGYGW